MPCFSVIEKLRKYVFPAYLTHIWSIAFYHAKLEQVDPELKRFMACGADEIGQGESHALT